MRPLASLALLVAAVVSARSARAESGVELEYSAPRGCPGADDLAAEIAARVAEATADSARFHFKVEIEASARGYAGRVSMLAPENAGVVREVENADCGELGRALAFIVAVIVSPRAEAEPKTVTAPDVESAPKTQTTTRETAPTGHPLAPSATYERALESAGERASGPGSLSFVASAALDLASARAPDLSPAARLAVAVRNTAAARLGAEARLSFAAGNSGTLHAATGDAELSWLFARGEGCGLAPAARSFSVAACATLESGRLRGAGSRAPNHAVQNSAWLAPGVLGRVVWQPLGVFELFVEASLFAPLIRPSFYFSGTSGRETVHRVPGAGASGVFGAGIRFW